MLDTVLVVTARPSLDVFIVRGWRAPNIGFPTDRVPPLLGSFLLFFPHDQQAKREGGGYSTQSGGSFRISASSSSRNWSGLWKLSSTTTIRYSTYIGEKEEEKKRPPPCGIASDAQDIFTELVIFVLMFERTFHPPSHNWWNGIKPEHLL